MPNFVKSEQGLGWGIKRGDYRDQTVTFPDTMVDLTIPGPVFARNYRLYMVFSDVLHYNSPTTWYFRGFLRGWLGNEHVFGLEWIDYKGLISQWSDPKPGFPVPVPGQVNAYTGTIFWVETTYTDIFGGLGYLQQLLTGGLERNLLYLVVQRNPHDENETEQYDARYFLCAPFVVRNIEIDRLTLDVEAWAPHIPGTTQVDFTDQHYIGIIAYHTF